MSRSQGGRIHVIIVTTPEDFKPDRPWNTPEAILSGRIFKKNLLAGEAKAFARVFNDGAIAERSRNHGQWNHEWAIVIPYLRKKWGSDHPNKPPRVPSLPKVPVGDPGLTYKKRRVILQALKLLASGISCEDTERRLNVIAGTVNTWFKENFGFVLRCYDQELSRAQTIVENLSSPQFKQFAIDERGCNHE
jgi:hypothetical protein